MSQITFIVNPVAGKGTGKKVFALVRSELDKRRVEYEVVETTGAGHATVAARAARSPIIAAVGGDGTINEVVNGLLTSSKRLGIIPAGSGNDFIKSVGIPRGALQALQVLLTGNRRLIDLGTVECSGSSLENGNSPARFFVNGVGIGFDAAVAARTREMGFLSGTALYVLAVLQTLGRYSPPGFRQSFDDPARESRKLLIAVGNGRCAGGGFFLTPDAKVDDGLLDICTVSQKSVLEILRLMPRVMRGKHHNVPGVKFFKEKQLTIAAVEPFYVHADGEIVGTNVNHVEITVQPSRLELIA